SLNYPGVKNPAADVMIEALLQARSEEDFTAAVRALDRVLISGDYVIPLFFLPKVWVAHWSHLRFPAVHPLGGYDLDAWWLEGARCPRGRESVAPRHCARSHRPVSGAMARPKSTPLAEDLADLDRLLARMRAGERRAISRAVTELERLSATAPRLLSAMQPYLGHALVIGFTGPPGAGQSTLP